MNQIHQKMIKMPTVIATAIVVAAVSMYAGYSYGVNAGASTSMGQGGAFAARAGGTGAGDRRAGGAAGAGFVSGEVLSKDATSVTVKMQDGGTKIVFIATSTQVMKATSSSLTDLAVGTNVTITGTATSDGSVVARSVQIRPQGATTDRR